MGLPFKPHIAKLPAYKPPAAPPGVTRIVDLSSNENPLGPSPKAMAALRDAIPTVHRYPDAAGAALKEALAAHYALRPTNVALGNGADEWVLLLCLALLNPGDEVLIAESTFISYVLRSIEVGAAIVRVPMKAYTHDLPAMLDAITECTRMIFVCNPNNPTGTAVNAPELADFLSQVPTHIIVVLDEAYYEYARLNPDYPHGDSFIGPNHPGLVVLHSFSKTYGLAGLRIGYALAGEEMIDYMERARPPFNVNRLAQVAALAALEDEEHVQRSVAFNESAKQFFYRQLQALHLPYIPSSANFIAFDASRLQLDLAGKLRERGFLVTPLDKWGIPQAIRFSFGAQEENESFAAVLKDIVDSTDAAAVQKS